VAEQLFETIKPFRPVTSSCIGQGLQSLANILSEVEDPDTEKNIIRRAWVAMHDVEEENAKLAVELWETLSFDLTPNIVDDLLVSLC